MFDFQTQTELSTLQFRIHNKSVLPKITEVYNTYWKFAGKRQEIFFKRFNHELEPWTSDSVLLKHKFTNAYRASDRVSQYLIRNVIYSGDQSPDEVFFRIILFKTFNKISTWEILKNHLGEIKYSEYSFEKYSEILDQAIVEGKSIYSGAYIMSSGKTTFGFHTKYKNHLRLIELLMKENVVSKIQEANSLESVFAIIREYPTIGDFLAMQYCIDLNYSDLINFSEMDFIVAGPGARDGILKCFSDLGEYSFSDIIKMMADNQEREVSRLNVQFKDLWGRPLQLIDCQNIFCEVDKYSRIIHPEIKGASSRVRIKQLFRPSSLTIDYFYPPKWGINDLINQTTYGL